MPVGRVASQAHSRSWRRGQRGIRCRCPQGAGRRRGRGRSSVLRLLGAGGQRQQQCNRREGGTGLHRCWPFKVL